MKKSHIYLLVAADPDTPRFKLGHSTDPYHRQKSLSQQFNLSRSLQMECDRATVRQLEGHLHSTFAEHQLDPAEIGDCEGRNEWFDLDCFDAVVSYLSSNWTIPVPIERDMRQLVIPISAELHMRLKLACIHSDVPVRQAVADLIEKTYKDYPLNV